MGHMFKLPRITRSMRLQDGAYLPDGYGQPEFPDFEILQNAFVDATVLQALNKLVKGPVAGWSDVANAELALRAFIFHDRVSSIQPEYHVFRITRANQNTPLASYSSDLLEEFRHGEHKGEEVVSEPLGDISEIQALLKQSQFHSFYSISDERLTTFSSDEVRSEHFRFRSECETERLQQRRIASIVMNPDAGVPHQFLYDETKYFDEIVYKNEDKVRGLISGLPNTGSAVYLGHPASRSAHEKHSLNLGGGFFRSLDLEWNQAFESMAHNGLGVLLPPLVTILLNRASTRPLSLRRSC